MANPEITLEPLVLPPVVKVKKLDLDFDEDIKQADR